MPMTNVEYRLLARWRESQVIEKSAREAAAPSPRLPAMPTGGRLAYTGWSNPQLACRSSQPPARWTRARECNAASSRVAWFRNGRRHHPRAARPRARQPRATARAQPTFVTNASACAHRCNGRSATKVTINRVNAASSAARKCAPEVATRRSLQLSRPPSTAGAGRASFLRSRWGGTAWRESIATYRG